MTMTDDNVSLDELMAVLNYAFHVEGGKHPIPLDGAKELLHLVAATEEGVLRITLKKRD
jgi:hypothetical protein